MRLSSPYERLHELMGLIERSPSIKQVVKLLSSEIDPFGEISGVSWIVLNENGILETKAISGLFSVLDSQITISLTDDNVVSHTMRTQKSIIFDLAKMYENYKDATHNEVLSRYRSGLVLPVVDKVVLGCTLHTPYQKLLEYEGYFECIRLVLALWQSKLFFQSQNIAQIPGVGNAELTSRQEIILGFIKDGKTNGAIARELGFSESLIRQETILIYSKLGVRGRQDLI